MDWSRALSRIFSYSRRARNDVVAIHKDRRRSDSSQSRSRTGARRDRRDASQRSLSRGSQSAQPAGDASARQFHRDYHRPRQGAALRCAAVGRDAPRERRALASLRTQTRSVGTVSRRGGALDSNFAVNSRALESDRIDLDPRLAWQRRHLNRRARRKWRAEMLSVDSVHNLELAKIDHEDGRLDDVDEIQSRRRQHLAEILQHATRFEFDSAFDDRARRRVERDLSRTEYQPALLDRLRIRTDRSRRLPGVNRGFHQ